LNAFVHAQQPGIKTELVLQFVPMRDVYSGKIRLQLLLVFAASALLLLTACANIASLFLARLASRAAEFATRIALGAGRLRILSHTLTETMLLAMLGGARGAAIAAAGIRLLTAYGLADLRLFEQPHLSAPVLWFASAASLGAALVSAVFPAWQAFRKNGSGRSARLRQILVGVEMTLGTALLASAGLLLHSFVKIMGADRGYQVERVFAVDLSLFGQKYSSGESRIAFYREVVENIRALRGIVAAGAISELPAASGASGASRTIFYATDTNFQSLVLARPVAIIRSVTTGYFAASGTVVLAGRFLTVQERAPVALISESLAKRLWPRDAPAAVVGRTLRQGDVTGPLITVAGVVEDVRPGALARE
jgi:hypothetical protein